MTTVSFDVPDESLHALRTTPEKLAESVRLAAAIYWYGRSEITLGTAAALAGLCQAQFMHALKAAGHDTFVVDTEDVEQELAFLAERRSRDSASG